MKDQKKTGAFSPIILTAVITLSFFTQLYAQDAVLGSRGQLIASNHIDKNQMSISYDGNPGSMPRPSSEKLNPSLSNQVFAELSLVEGYTGESKSEMVWAGEKIKNLAQYVLNYVSFDENPDADAAAGVQMRGKNHDAVPSAGKIALNFGVNVGMDDETQDVGISALKLRSRGFATHLDAVYDYKSESVGLFFSNDLLNGYLTDGMTLELQVNPQKSEGAFLFKMKF